jgi:hypothetical protein
MVIGFAVFTTSLYRIVNKKYKFETRVWHAASVALAGITVVSWAKYLSGSAAIVTEIILVALAIAFLIAKSSVITHNRVRLPIGVVLMALLSASAPAVLFINALDTPLVVVSPSNPNVALPAAGRDSTQLAAVGSVYADSWGIYMTPTVAGQSGSNQLLTAYINNSLGPFEIPFLQKGQELPISLRIVSSPLAHNGTYSVLLTYTYQDVIGHQYSGLSTVEVGVGATKGAPLPVLSYSVIGIVGFLAVVTVAILLRQFQTPRRRQ